MKLNDDNEFIILLLTIILALIPTSCSPIDYMYIHIFDLIIYNVY